MTETTPKERWKLKDHLRRFKKRIEFMMPREKLIEAWRNAEWPPEFDTIRKLKK